MKNVNAVFLIGFTMFYLFHNSVAGGYVCIPLADCQQITAPDEEDNSINA